eukprot:1158252-Pelagomonas_calceolata.AAC.6
MKQAQFCCCAEYPQEVDVFVRDTGIGIPEDKFEQIFQAFEQAARARSRYCHSKALPGPDKLVHGLGTVIQRHHVDFTS